MCLQPFMGANEAIFHNTVLAKIISMFSVLTLTFSSPAPASGPLTASSPLLTSSALTSWAGGRPRLMSLAVSWPSLGPCYPGQERIRG